MKKYKTECIKWVQYGNNNNIRETGKYKERRIDYERKNL